MRTMHYNVLETSDFVRFTGFVRRLYSAVTWCFEECDGDVERSDGVYEIEMLRNWLRIRRVKERYRARNCSGVVAQVLNTPVRGVVLMPRRWAEVSVVLVSTGSRAPVCAVATQKIHFGELVGDARRGRVGGGVPSRVQARRGATRALLQLLPLGVVAVGARVMRRTATQQVGNSYLLAHGLVDNPHSPKCWSCENLRAYREQQKF